LRALPQPAAFRPQGLITLSAACALRALAGSVSPRQRSWDSPCGAFSFRKVSARFRAGLTHVPFVPSVLPPPKRRAGPTGRGSWALTLPGVPGGLTVFSHRPLDAPLGFALPGCASERLVRDFARTPPARFSRRPALPSAPAASRSINRRSLSLTSPIRQAGVESETTLIGFLHQHGPDRSSDPLPGL
jgi:hypothetical protein